ncbi:MAG: MnmC family methyltransferase, partial [Cyanobacteria bacterium J06639_1]
ILDVCFGLGYNAGVAIALIQRLNPDCRIVLHALERSSEVPLQAHQMGVWSEWGFAEDWLKMVREGRVVRPHFEGFWYGGDARQAIAEVPESIADAVFFDPFASSACPELWTVDFFATIARRMKRKGRLATYSCSATVRAGLIEAGFFIGSTPPVGRIWPGTIASLTPEDLPPLSQSEREHLQTRAAVPYRDPGLCETRDRIRHQRQQAQQISDLEPTTQWKLRWTGRR